MSFTKSSYAGPSYLPAIHADGSITATISAEPYRLGDAALLSLTAPRGFASSMDAGRYFLVRCAEATPPGERTDWSIYLRVPLYFESRIAAPHHQDTTPADVGESPLETVRLLLSDATHRGGQWLISRPVGSALHLLGPFGRPAMPADSVRVLLIACEPHTVPLFLPAAHSVLDRSGRVALLLPPGASTGELLPLCPLDVEFHMAPDGDEWQRTVAELLRWCDHLCAATIETGPTKTGGHSADAWIDAVQSARFTLEPGFADLFVSADIVCATGACYACSVPRRSGQQTRACVHGPVIDLARLA